MSKRVALMGGFVEIDVVFLAVAEVGRPRALLEQTVEERVAALEQALRERSAV